MGFCSLLNMPKKKIWTIVFGSIITETAFEILFSVFSFSTFWATFIAALMCEIYSEAMARVTKSPAIIILLPSTIPLLPGGFLFYTMNGILSKNTKEIIYYGTQTIYVAFALAMSSIVALIMLNTIRRFTRK